MSDEPLYCTHCGIEWGEGHEEGCPAARPDIERPEDGPYCHTCGVSAPDSHGMCVACREAF